MLWSVVCKCTQHWCCSSKLSELNCKLLATDAIMMQGCAVIWSYIELFGQSAVKGCVFVDQAPLQNLTHDWKHGSKGCYDVASLTRMQCALEQDFPAFARGALSWFSSTTELQHVHQCVCLHSNLQSARKYIALFDLIMGVSRLGVLKCRWV